jgi:regulator of replication initiation timing
LGALLRREGLYSSHLTTWRRQRDEGSLSALTSKKRGRKAKRADPLVQENQQLRHEVQRLRNELKKAQTVIEVQKKLSEMLGTPMETSGLNGTDE